MISYELSYELRRGEESLERKREDSQQSQMQFDKRREGLIIRTGKRGEGSGAYEINVKSRSHQVDQKRKNRGENKFLLLRTTQNYSKEMFIGKVFYKTRPTTGAQMQNINCSTQLSDYNENDVYTRCLGGNTYRQQAIWMRTNIIQSNEPLGNYSLHKGSLVFPGVLRLQSS